MEKECNWKGREGNGREGQGKNTRNTKYIVINIAKTGYKKTKRERERESAVFEMSCKWL